MFAVLEMAFVTFVIVLTSSLSVALTSGQGMMTLSIVQRPGMGPYGHSTDTPGREQQFVLDMIVAVVYYYSVLTYLPFNSSDFCSKNKINSYNCLTEFI